MDVLRVVWISGVLNTYRLHRAMNCVRNCTNEVAACPLSNDADILCRLALTYDDQVAKLPLIVDVARDVWGGE